jgi:molecular chaperone GrpE
MVIMSDIKNKQDESQQQTSSKQQLASFDELKKQIEEIEGKYKRALADYQNLEKRVKEERGDLIKAANRDLLLRFLPVLDTLLMAQKHASSETIDVCIRLFLDILKQEGVTRIKTVGEKFDPHLMEVVTTTDGKEGVVIEEARAGFLLHDKLLRPAQVVVGSGDKTQKKGEEK